jgi:hypothetical protein
MPTKPNDDELVKTLIALTRRQHEWLRQKAFDGRTSIASEIRGLVAKAMRVEAKKGVSRRPSSRDEATESRAR